MINITKKIIVYSVSDNYEKIRDIEKSLWKNKQNVPFNETSIKIAPDTKPGYKGLFYLNVTDPSEELIKAIKPSYVSTGKYTQFESYTDNDMKDLIKAMVYSEKRDPKYIAKTLGVTIADVMIWSYYVA